MFKKFEFVAWLAGSVVRHVSNSAFRHVEARQLADRFNEFVRRIRRAGLLFIIAVSGLLAFSLILHPLGLLLWLIALPLAGFGSALSLLWPTTRSSRRRSAAPDLPYVVGTALRGLARSRGDIPPIARGAFDLVTQRVKSIGNLAADCHDVLVIDEARRLIGQHLLRLVESFVALPSGDRTEAHADALAHGLSRIAEELVDLNDRLRASRNDRFEIERRFIADRFARNGLAGV